MISYLLHVRPFIDKKSIKIEIINELFLTAIAYQMILLTGCVVLTRQKLEIGKILLHIIWLKLLFNFIVLIQSM